MAHDMKYLIGGILAVVFGLGGILKSKSDARDVKEFWGGWAADELFGRIGFIVVGVGFIIGGIIFLYQYFYG